MKKLVVAAFVTLDGVIEKPWEWEGSFFDEQLKQSSIDSLKNTDTFLMGRETYEQFSSTWPNIKGDPYFDKINGMDKFVVSNTLKKTGWKTKVLSGDIGEQLKQYKTISGKDIMKYGVGSLDQTLLEHHLVDEYQLIIVPMILHKKRKLFDGIDTTKISFRLKESLTFNNGVIKATYVPVYNN